MRVIFIGASTTAVMGARKALEAGHEAIVVEKDEAQVEFYSEELDCSFVHDDGSRQATLKELSPENTDMVCCLTDSDHDNIIAGLVAQALGFERVIVRIKDAEFEPICAELGLKDVLIPSREVGNSLIDTLEGREPVQLSSVLRGGWRFWGFTATDEHATQLDSLDLPKRARVIAVTRDDETHLAQPTLALEPGDHILLLAHEDELDSLHEQFCPS